MNLIKYSIIFTITLICVRCKYENESSIKSNNDEKNAAEIIHIIDSIMEAQTLCWNQGNITCYMNAYWQSDSLLFVGKSGINYGWQKTLDNYEKSYINAIQMGKLTFSNEVKQPIDNHTFLVIGKWQLHRNDTLGNLQGYYSLIWQNKNGKWVITSDHSS